MAVRILGRDDIRRLLSMEACIETIQGALLRPQRSPLPASGNESPTGESCADHPAKLR
jgi:hypothetical protein